MVSKEIDIKDVRCPVCDSKGKWENVDQYRIKPHDMHICNGCGFVFYPKKYMTEDQAKEYYKEDYRKPPTIGNAFTGQRKLHMHAHFLTDLMTKWKESGKDSPVVCDVGAAYGMFLNWFRSQFPKGEYVGTEFTESYRRNAWQEYELKLDLDFDKSKKYDLISSFKVAEHQLDVDKRLREYVECLKEDGHIYVSVPTWFKQLSNFGGEGFDLEYYYHPDHINVWTQKLFETLLKKVGLEIVKFDDIMYDETYLCKRNDDLMKDAPSYEDPKQIKKTMENIQIAFNLYNNKKFKEAVDLYPNYFQAWQGFYEITRKDPHMQDELGSFEYVNQTYIEPCLKACNRSLTSLRFAVDLCMRYNVFDKAIEYIKEALGQRPNQGSFLMALSHCFRQLALNEKDEKKKYAYYKESRDVCRYVREIDLQLKDEATNWIYQDNAQIPLNIN